MYNKEGAKNIIAPAATSLKLKAQSLSMDAKFQDALQEIADKGLDANLDSMNLGIDVNTIIEDGGAESIKKGIGNFQQAVMFLRNCTPDKPYIWTHPTLGMVTTSLEDLIDYNIVEFLCVHKELCTTAA